MWRVLVSAPLLRDDPGKSITSGDGPTTGAVMNWLILIFAGLLEVGWAVGLKYTEGFTKPAPSIVTLAMMAASLYLLSLAMRSLPMGAAYAVWVGIGMLGAVLFGIVFFRESVSLLKMISLLFIVVGIIGLKWSVKA